ncbi:MAG: hypothetical protein V4772_14960, partial [Pseudomonadota bacterium]
MDKNTPRAIRAGNITFPGTSGPVGEDKRPVRFYHGTKDDVAAIDPNHPNRLDRGWLGDGFYATSSTTLADMHAEHVKRPGNAGPNTMPVFMAVRNPFVATYETKKRLKTYAREQIDRFTQDLISHGYDGAVLDIGEGHVELVAFDRSSVKSAIGNNGNYDHKRDGLMFSRPASTPPSAATNKLQQERQALGLNTVGDKSKSESTATAQTRTPVQGNAGATSAAIIGGKNEIFPDSWSRFDPALNEGFLDKLVKFGTFDLNPNPGLRGGEGQLFLSEKNPDLALKRWYQTRIGDLAQSLTVLQNAGAVVRRDQVLNATLHVVNIHDQGSDWALRDFYPDSLPLKNALGDGDVADVLQRTRNALQKNDHPALLDLKKRL